MNSSSESYKSILKSTSIIASSSAMVIIIGVVRNKFLAILLGVSGIGAFGYMQSFVGAIVALGSLGIAASGAKLIAQYKNPHDHQNIGGAIKALLILSIVLSFFTPLFVFFFGDNFVNNLLEVNYLNDQSLMIAAAIFFTIQSTTQLGILQGFRKIKLIAFTNVCSSFLSTLVGLFCIYNWGVIALPLLLILNPFFTFIFSLISNFNEIKNYISNKFCTLNARRHCRPLFVIGISMTIYATLEQIAFLYIRSEINSHLGLTGVGCFQAAWTIAVVYLGLITNSMSTDFLPKISEISHLPISINLEINQQIRIGQLLGGPIICLMIGFADVLIKIMYSNDFGDAEGMLRFLLIVDIFKLITWPLGIAFIAMGESKTILKQGAVQLLLLVSIVTISIDYLGILSIPLGVLSSQLISICWALKFIHSRSNFILSKDNVFLFFSNLILICLLLGLICFSNGLGYILSSTLALLMIIKNYKVISRLVGK